MTNGEKLCRRQLKTGAVPTLFINRTTAVKHTKKTYKLSQKQDVNLCSVVNCLNVRNKLSCKGKSFFRFPKDEDRCKKWVQFCRREFPKHVSFLDLNKKYKICCDHFEDSQFNRPSERNSLVWNAVPTLLNLPNPPLKDTRERPVNSWQQKAETPGCVITPAPVYCGSCSMTESLPMVADGLPYFLQEHNYAQLFFIVAFIERSGGKRLYHRHRILPTESMPGKSIVAPHSHSGKEPLDRKKIETDRECQTARTESCSKSKRNLKRKLANKVKSNRKGMEPTNCTFNDEHSDTEQDFTIKIEREDDYDQTCGESYLSSQTDTASETETGLEKQVKVEPDRISHDSFEARSNYSEDSHGQSSHPADTLQLEPASNSTKWPDTGAATQVEVKTEPCRDTEQKPPVFFVASNMAHSTYLADSNMIPEPIGTIVKSEIESDPDDSEQATTVYVCESCNECFYSNHQLLNHRGNHTNIQIY